MITNPGVRVMLAESDFEAVGLQKINHEVFGSVKVVVFADKIVAGDAKPGDVLDHMHHPPDCEPFSSFDVHL